MLCYVYKVIVYSIYISFSLVKTDLFPDETILSEPDPFSLKYSFMVCQKVYCLLRHLSPNV